ncbi:uncharacterized protein LOC113331024 [Papaver somniferum]|uniref:uncharacterized protein LOC113331024 n=1 Tax=Papaver somniferum TaxID=3469 RepID=UPI000E70023A|nr:uncharacterized protein LOC113331024 [Papaver somniferum]
MDSKFGFCYSNPLTPQDPCIKVDYSIDNHTRTWNVSRLSTHFDDVSVKNLGINPSPCKTLWLHIWKIRVPHIIQLFLWKAVKNALPSRTVLHTRMPMHSVECARCNDPHENIMHTLVLCPFASKTSRNNLVFQNVFENHKSVIERARAMLLTRKNTFVATLSNPIALNHKWMPPLVGWIKCNTDRAFDDISGDNGAGYVMRNSTSKSSFCAAMVFEVSSAEEAEARAI